MEHFISLLSTILLYYPEISKINFDPRKQVVKFNFYLSSSVPEEKLKKFQKRAEQALSAFFYLEKKQVNISNLTCQTLDFFRIIEIERDIHTLSRKEIDLVISFLKEELKKYIITDDDEDFPMEDLALQEEAIKLLFENVEKELPETELVAMRDEGKVLVFNR